MGEGKEPDDDGKCSDDDFHILVICVVRPIGRTGYETYSDFFSLSCNGAKPCHPADPPWRGSRP